MVNTVTKNGRNMKKGRCQICGKIKTQFVKGGGLLNSAINKLPIEMHLPGHQFTGPGTKLDKRLNPDLTPKAWSKPINRVDNASLNHDICYGNIKDRKKRNEICDKNMIKELDDITDPTLRERLDKFIVKNVMNTKMKLGMGIKKKV